MATQAAAHHHVPLQREHYVLAHEKMRVNDERLDVAVGQQDDVPI